MSKTITFRVDESLREELERRATASGTTISQMVRETLREALEERPLVERIGHLKGSVRLAARPDPWRTTLRERNWRA